MKVGIRVQTLNSMRSTFEFKETKKMYFKLLGTVHELEEADQWGQPSFFRFFSFNCIFLLGLNRSPNHFGPNETISMQSEIVSCTFQ